MQADGDVTESGGTIVGITVMDGVLLMADTRSSQESIVGSETVSKIVHVHPTAVLGSTDHGGAARAFIKRLKGRVDRYEVDRGEPMPISALGAFAAREIRSTAAPGKTFVLGGVDNDGPHVLTISSDDGVAESKYAAVGSGRQLVYAVLDEVDIASLSMEDGRQVASRAIETAITRDIETGGRIQLAEITEEGVEIRTADAVDDFR